MKNGTIYAIDFPEEGTKFVGYTESSLSDRLTQMRAQKGRDPVLVWIQSLGDRRFDLAIRALRENCPRADSRELVRAFAIQLIGEGNNLLNGNCRKRVNRGTGSPIASELTYIYVLKHPVTHEIRYVGKTIDLKIRKKSHRELGKTRCDNWKRSLLADGFWPDMEVVENVPSGENWAKREQFWIKHYRDLGCNLTNLTEGGEGTEGRVITDAYREKMRKKFLGRPIPQEQREQISKSLTGLKQSPETVAKRIATWSERRLAKGLPVLGKNHEREIMMRREERRKNGIMVHGSEEYRKNAAEKQRAYYASLSPEQKEAMAAVRRGKPGANKGKKFGPMSPERRKHQSQKLKAYLSKLTPEQRNARMASARSAKKAKESQCN
jgi:hypothetical protein